MIRYIALLRGINISGKNKISMPELKTALGEKGFADVKTYLNSGIFSDDEPDTVKLAERIRTIIEATEKGVIPVLDAGIHLRKSLCCKEIDYRVKHDNDNFRSFSPTFSKRSVFFLSNFFYKTYKNLLT